MSNEEDEDFYRNLPRKELQSLCKKYGLPARKSSTEMTESLVSYFRNRNFSFACLGKSTGGIQDVSLPPSSVTVLQVEAPSTLTGHVLKDSCQLIPFPGQGDKGNRQIISNELESCMELRAHDKGASQSQFVSQRAENGVIHNQPCSGRTEYTPQCQRRCVNEGAGLKENISETTSYAKGRASFEFYVREEEGIKLCVDLSSSPLDWIKKYKNQVSFCNNADIAKSRKLHQELGCIGENNKKMKMSFPQTGDSAEKRSDGHIEAEPSQNLDMEENNIGIDRPGVNKVLMLLPSRACCEVLAEDSDCVREDLGPISSKPIPFQIISNTESCEKNGSSATAVSDVTDTQTEKTACNFVMNSISDGSVDLIATENHKSKYEDEAHENSILRINSDLENNYASTGFLNSCSTEIQLSETGNYHKGELSSPDKNGKLLDQDDSTHNVATEQAILTTSSENDHSGSHLAMYTEDQEWSNNISGRESSVCSQVDDSIGKTFLRSGNLELNEDIQKKRSAIDNEVEDGYGKRDTKFLRSMKHSAEEVLPRRSTRLVTKVLHSMMNTECAYLTTAAYIITPQECEYLDAAKTF
ncbi:hypothetical protein M5689_022219 [Euphorbia peplus]|nr:hypothetical protein M5689_022219 [Euphorbia peplus]